MVEDFSLRDQQFSSEEMSENAQDDRFDSGRVGDR